MGSPIERRAPGGAPHEKPRIETIGAAASEVTRLYGVLGAQAVTVDNAYLESRFAGNQGETWDVLQVGVYEKQVPLFPPIIKHNGRLKLDASMTFRNGITYSYLLEQGKTFERGAIEAQEEVLGTKLEWTRDGEISVPGAIRIIEGRDSRVPGSEFIVIGDKVLKTGYPRSLRTGGELSGKYSLLEQVEPALLHVIRGIQEYDK